MVCSENVLSSKATWLINGGFFFFFDGCTSLKVVFFFSQFSFFCCCGRVSACRPTFVYAKAGQLRFHSCPREHFVLLAEFQV